LKEKKNTSNTSNYQLIGYRNFFDWIVSKQSLMEIQASFNDTNLLV